jgi:hypothetical protein
VRVRGAVRPALLTLVVAGGGCAGDGEPAQAPARGASPSAPADARAPDRRGALTAAGVGGTFSCLTAGAVLLRLADDGVTLTTRERPLAYGGARALLVRRDCRRIAPAPHPFSRLAGRRWRGPRLTVTWRSGTLRCRTAATVHVSLARQRREGGALGAAPEGTDTEAFVLDAGSGRLVAIAWVAARGSRFVSTPACRPRSGA